MTHYFQDDQTIQHKKENFSKRVQDLLMNLIWAHSLVCIKNNQPIVNPVW